MVLGEHRGGAHNPDWRDRGSRKLSPELSLERIQVSEAQGGANIPVKGDGWCKGTEEAWHRWRTSCHV